MFLLLSHYANAITLVLTIENNSRKIIVNKKNAWIYYITTAKIGDGFFLAAIALFVFVCICVFHKPI